MRKYLMEFIGTFFLVMVIGFSGNPIAVAAVYAGMIYIGWNISGGHYNPAVSVAFRVIGKINNANLAGYIVAQILGAFIAALIFFLIQERTFSIIPAAGVEIWKSIILEFLFTFILCFVFLSAAGSDKIKSSGFYGLAIGLIVMTGIYSIKNITGAALNPATVFGTELVDTIEGGKSLSSFYIYLIGCFAGGILAAILHNYFVMETD